MAYVASTTPDDENEQLQTGNAQGGAAPGNTGGAVTTSTGTAGGAAKGAAGAAATGGATPTSGTGQVQESQQANNPTFTNLSAYLGANPNAGASIGAKEAAPITTANTNAATTLGQAAGAFNTAVGQGTDVYNPTLESQATSNPSDFVANPANVTAWQNMVSGAYSGPSSFESSPFGTTATTAAQTAQQEGNLVNTAGGQEQLLTQNNENNPTQYTQGGLSLDQFLGSQTGGLAAPTTAAQTASGFGNQLAAATTAGDTGVTNAQNTSTATGQQATSGITNAETALQNNITGAATAAQTTAQQQYQNLVNALNGQPQTTPPTTSTTQPVNGNTATAQRVASATSGGQSRGPAPGSFTTLTSDQLTQLGITQDQYSQLQALNQQAVAAGQPGINLTNYLTAPNYSLITPQSVATTQQIANWNALNQLVPGSNAQFLSGATGNAASANPTFDFNGALAALQGQITSGVTAGAGAGTAAPAAATSSGTSTALIGASLGASLLNGAGTAAKLYNAATKANTTANTTSAASQSTDTYTDPATGYTYNVPAGTGDVSPGSVYTDPSTGYTYNLPGDTGSTLLNGSTSAAGTGATGATSADGVADISASNEAGISAAADESDAEAGDALSNSGSGLASGLAEGVSVVGAALATYNLISNYQSGDTAGDTIRGAEAGAAIGTAIMPGIGTAVGAVIGTVVGAISSAIGPGKTDPETTSWNSYLTASQQNPQLWTQVSDPYTLLAGVLDEKSSTVPIYSQFGRMGEQKFTVALTQQIQNAVNSGKISATTPAAQVYSSVVAPWVASMGNWNNVGPQYTQAINGLLQQMTSQYMDGSWQTAWTPVGGQSVSATFGNSITPLPGTAAAAPVTVRPSLNSGARTGNR